MSIRSNFRHVRIQNGRQSNFNLYTCPSWVLPSCLVYFLKKNLKKLPAISWCPFIPAFKQSTLFKGHCQFDAILDTSESETDIKISSTSHVTDSHATKSCERNNTDPGLLVGRLIISRSRRSELLNHCSSEEYTKSILRKKLQHHQKGMTVLFRPATNLIDKACWQGDLNQWSPYCIFHYIPVLIVTEA